MFCKKNFIKKSIFGIIAEYVIIIFYVLCGYKILNHRFRWHNNGEIDVIAYKNDTVVFVEVKARRNPNLLGITKQQRTRIKKTLKFFLLKNIKYKNFAIRIDFAYVNHLLFPQITKNIFL